MNAAVVDLHVRWLGRTNFANALALQEEIVAKKREDPSHLDELLLLEHEPVYTIGRTPDQSSLLGAAHLPHPLFAINRGGQATYHGPGQLMGYPIIDLRRCGQDLHKYLRWLERLLIELLAGYGITASRRKSLTGVWIGNCKIASIGVGVRHWVTMHGFALNVCGDLSPFERKQAGHFQLPTLLHRLKNWRSIGLVICAPRQNQNQSAHHKCKEHDSA